MCLAIPQEIIKIKGKTAWTKAENHRHQVDLSLLKNIKVGDFIIATQDLAINKISKSNAKKIIKMVNELRK